MSSAKVYWKNIPTFPVFLDLFSVNISGKNAQWSSKLLLLKYLFVIFIYNSILYLFRYKSDTLPLHFHHRHLPHCLHGPCHHCSVSLNQQRQVFIIYYQHPLTCTQIAIDCYSSTTPLLFFFSASIYPCNHNYLILSIHRCSV